MLFFGKQKEKKEYYFGLFLKSEEAVAFVFEVLGTDVTILAYEKCAYTNGWENIVYDIDTLVSKLEKITNAQPKQVIYFVYSYFVNPDGDLKEPYKSHIKSISRQLELRPLGYIECYEVVAAYLEKRDKAPLNVILIELDKHNVDICIYKASKKLITRTAPRTSNLIDDLSVVFNEIKDLTLLPSRLVLYDSSDLDDESVKILGHKWEKDVFIQHPRVEVIKQENLYTQLAEVFIKQLKTGGKSDVSSDIAEDLSAAPVESEIVVPAQEIASPVKEEIPVQPAAQSVITEKLGFTIDQPAAEPRKSSFKIKHPKFTIPKIKFGLPRRSFGLLLAVIGVVIIIGSLFTLEYYFHKATITVILPSKHITKELQLPILDIQTGTISASVKDTANTTGKRDVGEKAIGEVTIHNFEDASKSFTKATVIEVDGKQFTLDQDVTVASSSEVLIDGDPVKKPGKGTVKVTAKEIGPEGNMAKDKRFKIDSLSTSLYFAVNDTAFSGGTRKSVKTVAKKDIDDLKKVLTEKAKKEVADKVQAIPSSNSMLIDNLTQIKIVKTDSSHEISEEAASVTVTIDVEATYYAYDPDALKKKVAEQFTSDVPDGYKLDDRKVIYTMMEAAQTGGVVNVSLSADAVAAKSIPEDAVTDLIVGKSQDQIKNLLEKELQVFGYTFNVESPIPFMKNWTPFFKKNITVQMDTAE